MGKHSRPIPVVRHKSFKARWLICLALVVGTFALYWPVRTHDFIWLDDPDYITENAFVKMGLSWESIAWAFTQTFASNWHPLTWISHMLDWQLFGTNAGGHHLTSVTFHAANSLILLLFLNSATGAFWRSAIVAALFAWHPTHVESVAWVSERKDVFSTFFGLLSLWAYVKYASGPRGQGSSGAVHATRNPQPAWQWYSAALVLFALGLMCKPMLVTWPFVMLLLDFWPLQRVPGIRCGVSGQANLTHGTPHLIPGTPHLAPTLRRLVVEKIPFLTLVVASCVITILAQNKWRSLANADQFPLEYRLVNALVSYAAYLGKLLWPVDLAVFYPFPADAPWESALFCGLLLGAVTAVALWRSKIWPFLPTGWFWYLGTLVPVIGIVQVGGQAMADRYTYIPSIGFFVVLVWLVAELAGPKVWRRAAVGTLAVVALVICLPFSARQIATWKNTRTLFEHARSVTTGNFIALNILGELLWHEGKSQEAIQYYREAVQAGPSYPFAWCGLGMALYADGQKEEGIACQRQALKLNPDNPQALVNLGLLLLWENKPAEAEPVFRRAVEVRPGFAEANANLGLALEALGRNEEALDHFVAAVKFKPDAAPLRLSLAAALVKLKRVDEALAEYQTALELKPENLEVRLTLANRLMEIGRTAEATEGFRRAVEQSPTNVLALDGLGCALAQAGQIDEALNHFRQALELSPTNAFVRLHLGMMLQRKDSAAEAATEYRRAIEHDPHLIAALNNLAWLLATHPDAALRNGAEAVALAKRACELTEEREPHFIGTLAAAHAEAGQFAEAITAAEKARDLAREMGAPEIARRNEELLLLYRAGKPFHESKQTVRD